VRSGRGRSTLAAPLDLKWSCDLAALRNLDRGSGRTRRHTEHRIRPGDPCWNVYMCRGKPCRQTRALGRSHCERCILIRKNLSRYFIESCEFSSFLYLSSFPDRHPRPPLFPVDTRFIKIDFRSNIRRAFINPCVIKFKLRLPFLRMRPDTRAGYYNYGNRANRAR